MTINPKEAPKGYRAVRGNGLVANDCVKCAFGPRESCTRMKRCLPYSRDDECDVYFVKLPKSKKPAKPRRFVKRWLLAYEMTNERGEWLPRLNTLSTRQLARRQSAAYRHLPYVRNIAPPQAVKVGVS